VPSRITPLLQLRVIFRYVGFAIIREGTSSSSRIKDLANFPLLFDMRTDGENRDSRQFPIMLYFIFQLRQLLDNLLALGAFLLVCNIAD
jgi:hypothetical protein